MNDYFKGVIGFFAGVLSMAILAYWFWHSSGRPPSRP